MQEPKIVYGPSSSSGISGTHSRSKKSLQQPHSGSQVTSNSFKPQLTKEIKQLERTNKKLKKHNEQYKKYYEEMVMGEQLEAQAQQMVPEELQKPFKTKDSSNSIMSGSTSQGFTVRQSLAQNPARNNHIENQLYRLSQDFDSHSKSAKSKSSGHHIRKISSKKKSAGHRKTHSKPYINTNKLCDAYSGSSRSNNSPMAAQILNKKMAQVEPTWKEQSQVSLNKMQQLQKEYEQIQHRRLKIMSSLGELGEQVMSPEQIAESVPLVLKDQKPRVKNF